MIITHTKDPLDYSRLNIFPDNFVSEKKKQSKEWIKDSMDYFEHIAISQYNKNRESWLHNYELVKGILKPEDFAQDQPEEITSFIDNIVGEKGLPSHVKHYPIINPPLNSMIGELSKRPDVSKVKAFDDESKNEELQFKTEILQQFTLQKVREIITAKMAMKGIDIDLPEVQEQMTMLTEETVEEYLTSYTSLAERWGNHMLENVKIEFNMKEKSEDSYRDLLIAAREFHHIYEDNSRLGFNYEVLNPKNVWYLTTPDKKYIKDAFAAGTIHVMELSEIIERFNLSKKEIDHLRESIKEYTMFGGSKSNIGSDVTGEASVNYDTYSRTLVEERLIAEGVIEQNEDPLDFFGASSNIHTFGYKYRVIQAYWISKKQVAKVNYLDEDGELQTTLVDGDDYEPIPNQVGQPEFGYVNQWYRGYKISHDIYFVEPLAWADYCPIIGVVHEIKNTEAKSLIDLMKPLQMLYNVCMNQLFELLEKELGVIGIIPIRRIPTPKDGDGQDALEIFEVEAKRKGLMYDDDSPENTKAPMSNTNVVKAVDLNRSAEMQARYQLAVQLKMECWELVGFSRERLGGSAGATQTATSVQNSVSRSYNQTEPYFVQHEYVMNQVYQSLLDMALYVESAKPQSTVSYVNSVGEQAFIRVNGTDLSMRDLKVYVTSRAEDQRMFEELRALAQPMLQNGASVYDVSVLYTTNSVRQMKDMFRRLKEKQEEFMNNQQQMEQQGMAQQKEIAAAQLEQNAQLEQFRVQNENMNKELDRLNKKEVALINALGRNENATADNDGSGVADALEITKLSAEREAAISEGQAKQQEMAMKMQESQNKLFIELQKVKNDKEALQVERENMKNDLQIAKLQARAKAKEAKNKPKPKK